MAERPPATDLSGGKASADSLVRLMANLAALYAVDFQSDPFLSVAFGLTACSEGFDFSSCLVPVAEWVGSWAALPRMRGMKPLSKVVRIPPGSRFCGVGGTDVGKIEDPIPRSGCE